MNINISSEEFELMQRYIEEECGISIGNDKAYLIESRLSGMLRELGCSSYGELYNHIYNSEDKRVAQRVIDAITTNETLWFRDKTPWAILEEELLPLYVEQLKSREKDRIRIWSAGCSTGQEPYSIAMTINSFLEERGLKSELLYKFEIIGTDISPTVLDMAKNGRYDNISIMRGLPVECRDRYFKNEGRIWTLDRTIMDMVELKQFNLQNSFMLLGKFDIIFCRYVMIYFSPEFKVKMAEKLHRALNTEGVLFVGSSEMFSGHRELFDTEEYRGGVYYRKKEETL